MNFYTFLQQQAEREDNIGRLAQSVQAMEASDQARVGSVSEKSEHKTWVNIIVSLAKNMDEIGAFNEAWREYQRAAVPA